MKVVGVEKVKRTPDFYRQRTEIACFCIQKGQIMSLIKNFYSLLYACLYVT